jgi:hypothetical protein
MVTSAMLEAYDRKARDSSVRFWASFGHQTLLNAANRAERAD